MQAHQARLTLWVDRHVVAASLLFLVIYVLTTALSLPGRPAHPGGQRRLRHPVGALAGLLCQLLGATLAFLSARFLLRDWVETRFGDKLASVQAGMQRRGLLFAEPAPHPLFPFFLVNLVMGLTPIRVSTYYWVSQLGMLPGTLVYVLAGSELATLTSTGNLFSPTCWPP